MVLSEGQKFLIKALLQNGYNVDRIVREFPEHNFKRRTVYDLKEKIQQTGSTNRRAGSGRPTTVRNEENIEVIRGFSKSPVGMPGTSLSIRQLHRRTSISRTSIRRIIKKDLNLKTVQRQYTFKLTPAAKIRRVLCCRQFLRRFRTREQVSRIWFSDEKKFTLDPPKNSNNDRYRIDANEFKRDIPLERAAKERGKYSPYVMVWVAISKNHKSRLIFLPQGERLNARRYIETILQPIIPELHDMTPECTFMQVKFSSINVGPSVCLSVCPFFVAVAL